MTMGEKLRSARESKGLSQKELANHLGVTTGIVAEWESDENAPNLSQLARLSKVLEVSSDVLLEAEIEETAFADAIRAPESEASCGSKTRNTSWFIGVVALAVLTAVAIILYSTSSKDDVQESETTTITAESISDSGEIDGTEDATNPTELLDFSENPSAIEAADASVVTIFCYDYSGELAATGSGFVAFDGKTIITNYHVMTSAYTCKISTNQDITYNVSKILCYSKNQDIAILHLSEDTGLQPLTLGDSSAIKKGEKVVAIGSPLGVKNTVSTGVLGGRQIEGNMYVLQITAPISSGSSGGALFDDNGNVIGITYASYVDGQNLNFAIPIELAVETYEKKAGSKPVSAICEAEYPYVKYLGAYKDVPVVTLEELKKNPQKYDDKIVRLSIYVSSWYDNDENWFLAEKNNVSLDGDYDLEMSYYLLDVPFQEMPITTCFTKTRHSIYVDDKVRPGDRIELIAYFEFCAKGEPWNIGDFGGIRNVDMGRFYSIIIWKA